MLEKETHLTDIISVRIQQYLFNVVFNKRLTNQIGTPDPAHNHHYYEFHILMEGDCVIVADNKVYKMDAGNIYLIAPSLYHYIIKKSTNVKKYSIRFGYSKLKLDDHTTSQKQEEFLNNVFPVIGFHILKDIYKLSCLVDSMHYEIAAKEKGFSVNLQALFVQSIVILARTISLNKDCVIKPHIDAEKKPLQKNIDTRKCLLIENFFDNNCHRLDIHPEDLAKLLYISERQLNRILMDIYKLSFKQKIIETRIELAKYLLINKNLTVSEVCERVGYIAVNTFSNLFRKQTGISPSKYRNYSKQTFSLKK
jgi:AraC-like DNA-binding protein